MTLSGGMQTLDGVRGGRYLGAPALLNPVFAAMNTTVMNDLSPDGLTWAQVAGAAIVDSFGTIVIYAQRYNSNTRQCFFVWSNDNGATWQDNAGISNGEGFLTRGDIVYDSGRDCFHSLIVTTNPSDGGIIYRRYAIARDGSNHITSVARVAGVSVVLDDAGADNGNGLEFPTILMPNANTLLAAWTVRTAAPGGEIRCCKCDITSNADAGGTASNWVHIGVNSTTTIGAAPAVASYTIPFSQSAANAATYFSLRQLASGDLRWVYHGGPTPGSWATRRSVLNAAVTWNTLSSPVTITNVQRAGVDIGYSLKNQLISQLSEAGGVAFVGLATWKDDTAGDTWGVYALAANDTVAHSADIYSAGGVHSYAPSGDCAYDAIADRVVATSIATTTQHVSAVLLDTSLILGTPVLADSAAAADIPLILATRQAGKLHLAYRVAGSPPQIGRAGTLDWSA